MAQISIKNKPAALTGVSPFFLSHGYNGEEIVLLEGTPILEGTPNERARAIIEKLFKARNFAESALVVA